MGVLRTDLKAPSPIAAATMERLAAIISKRSSQGAGAGAAPESMKPGPDVAATGDVIGEGGRGGGTSRAWPGGVHACDVHRLQEISGPKASPDVVVISRRGVHEFIGLIDTASGARAAADMSTEGANGGGSDAGDHAGRDRTGGLGVGALAPCDAEGHASTIARTLASDGARSLQTPWSPPLTFMAWLAWRAMALSAGGVPNDDRDQQTNPIQINSIQADLIQADSIQAHLIQADPMQATSMPAVAWVGRRVWPSPQLLHRCRGLLQASLFIDCDGADTSEAISRATPDATRSAVARNRGRRATSPTLDMRAWAAEQAIRCGGCVLVVADGSGFSRVMTQRLLLASETGSCSCLLARPPGDMACLSAATTRWLLKRAAGTCSIDDRSHSRDAKDGTSSSMNDKASPVAIMTSGEVWSTGWTARLWRSKGAAMSPSEREQAWLLRMVHRVDDFTRFNDLQRNANRRTRGDHGADLAASGFDLVPVLADRSAAATTAASCDNRRVAG